MIIWLGVGGIKSEEPENNLHIDHVAITYQNILKRKSLQASKMIILRKSSERGSTRTSWLNSQHTFSFASYHDPFHMSFGVLRVINEDTVAPSGGFPPHSHQDMEIVSYVIEGALQHKDSLGNGSIIYPGEVQLMSAGSGITHSEFNPSDGESLHFLQIWVIPNAKGLKPSYQQKNFNESRKSSGLTLLVSQDGEHESLAIHQDVKIYILDLQKDHTFSYALMPERMLWIQVAKGNVFVNDNAMQQGDGASCENKTEIEFKASEKCELLLFDLNQRYTK